MRFTVHVFALFGCYYLSDLAIEEVVERLDGMVGYLMLFWTIFMCILGNIIVFFSWVQCCDSD